MTSKLWKILVPASLSILVTEEIALSQTLTPADVTKAMDDNSELSGKIYGRVDFHIVDETGAVIHVETIPKSGANFNAVLFSYPVQLPSTQRCVAGIKGLGAGTIVYWCDPASNNKLQSDIFQMLINGSRGRYLVSYKDISCLSQADDIPDNIQSALC